MNAFCKAEKCIALLPVDINIHDDMLCKKELLNLKKEVEYYEKLKYNSLSFILRCTRLNDLLAGPKHRNELSLWESIAGLKGRILKKLSKVSLWRLWNQWCYSLLMITFQLCTTIWESKFTGLVLSWIMHQRMGEKGRLKWDNSSLHILDKTW